MQISPGPSLRPGSGHAFSKKEIKNRVRSSSFFKGGYREIFKNAEKDRIAGPAVAYPPLISLIAAAGFFSLS
jgi:hypothetical protein